jgi:hypothetical protein
MSSAARWLKRCFFFFFFPVFSNQLGPLTPCKPHKDSVHAFIMGALTYGLPEAKQYTLTQLIDLVPSLPEFPSLHLSEAQLGKC